MKLSFKQMAVGQSVHNMGYEMVIAFAGAETYRDHVELQVGMSPKEVAEKFLELAARLDSRT